MEYKAALFDLDGVIVDTAKYHYLAWKQLADKLGIYFDKTINERLKGVSRMASLEIILEKSTIEYTDEQKEEMCASKNEVYLQMIQSINKTDVLPGMLQLIQDLQVKGLKLAVCSASKSAVLILDKLELTPYFDTIVDGNQVTKPKPDPEVFTIARDRFKLDSSQCIVFEDAYAGIQAGLAAGMYCIGIGSADVLTNPHVLYASTAEISADKILG